jgi:hypothetical protein
MILGAQTFNLTGAPFVMIGFEDYWKMCSGSLRNETKRLIEGRVAIVYMSSIYNRTCLIAQQLSYLQERGSLGVVFVMEESVAQLPATLWSVRTGANSSTLPVLFLEDAFVLGDVLLASGQALVELQRDLLPDARITMSQTVSNWSLLSSSFGVIFQVMFSTWSAVNVVLSVYLLGVTVTQQRNLFSFSPCKVCFFLFAGAGRLFLVL